MKSVFHTLAGTLGPFQILAGVGAAPGTASQETRREAGCGGRWRPKWTSGPLRGATATLRPRTACGTSYVQRTPRKLDHAHGERRHRSLSSGAVLGYALLFWATIFRALVFQRRNRTGPRHLQHSSLLGANGVEPAKALQKAEKDQEEAELLKEQQAIATQQYEFDRQERERAIKDIIAEGELTPSSFAAAVGRAWLADG